MSFLCLILEAQLRVCLLEACPGTSITTGGQLFTQRATEEVVFYDWIVDATTGVHALEIHLPPDHPLLKMRTPLSQLSYVDTDCFVRIWLTRHRSGVPAGKEAFGDLFFFQAEDCRLAIVVGIQEWLSSRERELLLSNLGREYPSEPSPRRT
jgi:hypothetical protein